MTKQPASLCVRAQCAFAGWCPAVQETDCGVGRSY